MTAPGDSHPRKIVGNAKARPPATFDYRPSCMLDVEACREAESKSGDGMVAQADRWKTLRDGHAVGSLRLQVAVQQSRCSAWEPRERVDVSTIPHRTRSAAHAADAHWADHETSPGLTEYGVMQPNVFSLYTLGTVTADVRSTVANSLAHVVGLTPCALPRDPNEIEEDDHQRCGDVRRSCRGVDE